MGVAQTRGNARISRQRRWVAASASFATLTLAAFSVASQAASSSGSIPRDSTQAGSSLSCAKQQCQVTLTKVTTLSAKGHSLQIPVPYVVRDRQGRFLSSTADRSQIAVFDASGRFVSTVSLARQATRSTMVLLPAPTGPLAWTSPEQSFSITEALTAQPLSAKIPYRPSFVMPDGAVIVAQQIQDANLIGHPVHVVAPNGQVRKSFGADPPKYRPDLRLLMERVAAPAADGLIWTAAVGRYVIEKWDPTTGARRSHIPVKSSWFGETPNHPTGQKDRPRPIVLGLWERDGLLWTLIRDADANWKASAEPERRWSPSTMNEIYDWVIEAIDPASGAVLASLRSGSSLIPSSSQALVISYTTNPPDGLELWIPVLSRKGMP